MEIDRNIRQVRSVPSKFETRSDDNGMHIEGYFAVFNSDYNLGYGMSESIAPGAFTDTLADDIRALVNHDTTLVLGRTSAHTLEVTQDERGLWGKVKINPNDQDAMNLYARVQRGDVSQCSIGFDILDEETEYRGEDVHWTIRQIKLYEVSACTFPAYEETAISARMRDVEELKKRSLEAWREKMMKRMKGESDDGTQSVNA
jgi:HK97 family phage prohead protease